MVPLLQFMPAALAEVLRRAPLSPEKVHFAWRAAVGAAVDNASAVELRGDTLVVHVKQDEWKREITRSAPLIRSRLADLLGPGVVRRLDVTVGSTVSRLAPGA